MSDEPVDVTRPYQDHYAQLYFRVLDDKRVTNKGIATYVGLARFADWKTGILKVSRAKLAKVGRVSVKTIDRGLTELADLGYIAIEKTQRDDGSWAPSSYQLLDTAIAQQSRGGDSQSLGGSDSQSLPSDTQSPGVVPHSPQGGDSQSQQEQTSSNEQQLNNPPANAGVGSLEAVDEGGKRRRRTKLDPNFLPPVEEADKMCAELKVPRSVLVEWHREFIDYWVGDGRVKADWLATWRNSMRHKARTIPPNQRRTGSGQRYFPGQGMFS